MGGRSTGVEFQLCEMGTSEISAVPHGAVCLETAEARPHASVLVTKTRDTRKLLGVTDTSVIWTVGTASQACGYVQNHHIVHGACVPVSVSPSFLNKGVFRKE